MVERRLPGIIDLRDIDADIFREGPQAFGGEELSDGVRLESGIKIAQSVPSSHCRTI